ncbi:lipopolysaccharide biosynthesis protein [Bacillus toyonensis]|uniref:lipopolysaccharide biosynthesis protein n=1 Tax=Bacillus toyonensis TaxID=155322 RepID=UPI0009CE4EAA|nr:oligosaccharide flippase family protein [Bacillus toyonensis]OQD33325.1 Polysaccharide biosynthesis protein [Bacillus toyonensis]
MVQLLANMRGKIHNNIIQLRKKGFFSLLLTKFLVQFVGFGSVILVAKFISPESMAQIKSLQTYLILAVLIGTFGLDTAILKYCSEPREEGEKKISSLICDSKKYNFLCDFCNII